MSNDRRKPTWTICVNDAREGERPRWRNIGAAWETQSGNLFVKVDEGESLEGTAMMFPYREKPAGGYRRPERPRPPYPPQRLLHLAGVTQIGVTMRIQDGPGSSEAFRATLDRECDPTPVLVCELRFGFHGETSELRFQGS